MTVDVNDIVHFDPRRFAELGLADIAEKVRQGTRLSLDEGRALFACPDVTAVGALAHLRRTALHGQRAYYVVNRNINYTNVCAYQCTFCAFSKGKTDEDLRGAPYVLDLAEMKEALSQAPVKPDL